MEKAPQAENVIYHFSHIHPLQVHRNHTTIQPNCCDPITADSEQLGPLYGCGSCSFFLHRTCTDLLPMVRHPAHPHHTLTLVATSPYLKGSVVCDACTTTIRRFFYHCTQCSFDIHTHCAFLPPTTNHASHPHQLILLFSSSYEAGSHVCDLCGEGPDGRSWIYRCDMCGFDAHVDCALAWAGGIVPVSPTLTPMKSAFVELAPSARTDPDTPAMVGEQDHKSLGADFDRRSNADSELEGYELSYRRQGSVQVGGEMRNSSPEFPDNGVGEEDVEQLQMTLAKEKMLPGVGVIGLRRERAHGGRYG